MRSLLSLLKFRSKQRAHINRQNKLAKYLKNKYILPYIYGELQKFDAVPKINLGTDKVIWQYWGQGVDENTHDVVKMSLDSVEKFKGEYKHIILTDDTIEDYIDIPKFVYEKRRKNRKFKNLAFFSDLLRLYLLKAYGGVWIDATILLSDNIPKKLLDEDFFAFQRIEKPEDYNVWESYSWKYFNWNKNFRVNLLNSFIIAKKNNVIIDALLNTLMNYWKNENKFKHYFLFQIMFDELMKIKFFEDANCEKISDLLPHLLQLNYKKDYDAKLLEDIYSKSSIHKLTYIKNSSERSLYNYLLEDYKRSINGISKQ